MSKRQSRISAAAIGLLIAFAAAAEPPPRLLGLLELRGVGEGDIALPAPLPLYADATLRQPLPAAVALQTFETRELSYEQPALLVFGRSREGYRIALADGRHAWLASADSGPFHALAELLPLRLTYLHHEWNGVLWMAPGQKAQPALPPDPGDERIVQVSGSREVDGALWLQIELLAESPCEGGDGGIAARGWVPAHRADGEPWVWFYSRGC